MTVSHRPAGRSGLAREHWQTPVKGALACATTLALVLALAACGNKRGTPDASGAPEVGVVTVKASPATLTTELPGRVSAIQSAEVRPQISGIVRKRLFTEGSLVKAGDVLYQIDDATYKAAVDSAQGTLTQAEANLDAAKIKAARYAGLLKINGVSQQDYDNAQATAKADAGAVQTDRAALETARIDLDRTRIKAPISGRIGTSSVTAGALVTASQDTALATINDLSTVYVDVTQSSLDLLRLKKELAAGKLKASGNAAVVQLRLEDGSLYAHAGKLAFADVTVSTTTGSVTLRAQFPNPEGTLLPNMYVRAELQEGVDEQGLLVPQKSVQRDAKGNASVMVVDASGKVASRDITLTRNVGNNALVGSGLASGDKVLVDSLQNVRAGMHVKPVEVASALSDTPAAASAATAMATTTAAR
ncbi:efflux RND transporter periplasmic adaptor subunit [Pandoraea terrigena]|uniref:Efflux transporter periplasmic adaptor subunit n=1 Tax=Pandoraea terrigena TaxID=2508292 RepID=A0A5E4XND0_9BURK|nr:efflux RND transporter periplasmic adaptor subunit [Pandoraea terrigena]VVE38021.1 efflux transporter periplasmic adaptor subunit [Pandoraea terrigena]